MTIQIVQLVAYISLTLGSITVAAVSLFLAYRQNIGWEPILLITRRGLQGEGGNATHHVMTLEIEVWNRRKYPIVIRSGSVEFDELTFERVRGFDYPRGWLVQGKRIHLFDTISIDPSSHYSVELRAPFKTRSLDDLEANVAAEFRYFDPRRNKHRSIKDKSKYSFRS